MGDPKAAQKRKDYKLYEILKTALTTLAGVGSCSGSKAGE